MAHQISDEIIENVCILAKLSLQAQELETAKKDMQRMLDYMDKLNELDTEHVKPLCQIFETGNIFREDEITNSSQKEEMLLNAPEQKEGQYLVPKTIG